MGIQIDGIMGEQMLFKHLRRIHADFFQPDAIYKSYGKYYVAECKHQEQFTPPPFYGHGLPLRQVNARLLFQKETNVRCVLFIFEKPYTTTKKLYWQYLDILESGNYFDTGGNSPRRVYPIDNFILSKI